MNRRFRLATVERLRTARMEAGGRELVAANTAVQAARERRSVIVARLEACHGPLRATPENFISVAGRRERLREELAAVDTEVADLMAAAQRARADWLRARAELRAVQSLHQRHIEALRHEEGRREQAELDDLAGTRSLHGRSPARTAGAR